MNEDKFKALIEDQKTVLGKIDAAYTQILYPATREDGLRQLESLRGQDKTIPVIIGYAHELNFHDTHEKSEAEKAIQEYESAMMDGDFQFLQDHINKLNVMLKNNKLP